VVAVGDVGRWAGVEALRRGVAGGGRGVRGDLARAEEIPSWLRRWGGFGRSRFGPAGEGTGKGDRPRSVRFALLHLTVWNRARREVVGAYRLGRTDEILRSGGWRGCTRTSCSDYTREMLERLGPALELGGVLWRAGSTAELHAAAAAVEGVGRSWWGHPEYRYYWGREHQRGVQSASVRLMVQFLEMHHGGRGGGARVSARTPFRGGALRGVGTTGRTRAWRRTRRSCRTWWRT